MSILTCTACGHSAHDNYVTWPVEWDARTQTMTITCDACAEYEDE